jgi:hypothetical protein
VLEEDDLWRLTVPLGIKDPPPPAETEQPEPVKLADTEPPLLEAEVLQLLAFAICVDILGIRRIMARAIIVHIENTNFCILLRYITAIKVYCKIILRNHLVDAVVGFNRSILGVEDLKVLWRTRTATCGSFCV